MWLVVVAVGALVALVVGLVVGMVGNNDKKSKASAGEVFLAPANDPGANPFTPNVGVAAQLTSSAGAAGSSTSAAGANEGGGVGSNRGDRP